MRKLFVAIGLLAAAGVMISSYALWQHFAPAGSGFCNVSGRISCDLVNQSQYSEIFGIPVSLIGIIGYTALLVLALAVVFDAGHAHEYLPWLLAGSIGALGFSLYLTYLELFVIGAICILCVASQAIIIVITGATGFAYRSARRDAPVTLFNTRC